MMSNHAEFTVAELRAAAGEAAFAAAGRHMADIDGPHEDDWSLYATIRLDDGQELGTILHHRAGKPLQDDCICGEEPAGRLCSHLVWVGLVHLSLDAGPSHALAAETMPVSDLRVWLATLGRSELIELIIEAATENLEYRRRLGLRSRT
jgi:hypothetical protein